MWGVRIWAGGHPQTPAKGRRPLDSRVLHRDVLIKAGHPRTPAKGRRPSGLPRSAPGRADKGRTPPDPCPRAAPSGLPLLHGDVLIKAGHSQTPAKEAVRPLDSRLLHRDVLIKAGHPQTPAKGRRPSGLPRSAPGRADKGRALLDPCQRGCALWTPAFCTGTCNALPFPYFPLPARRGIMHRGAFRARTISPTYRRHTIRTALRSG